MAKLRLYLKQLETITSDPELLTIVKGFNIPFRQISQPITRTPLEVQPILDQKIQLQPNFSCSKEGRRYIFRRYANYRLLCPGDNAVYSDSDEPYLSGVHYSQGEINNNSNSNHHLSGVTINSITRQISLPPEKVTKTLTLCRQILTAEMVSLRLLA